MGERHDDLVDALRDLGDGLVVARSGESDPVAGALRQIAAAPSTAAAATGGAAAASRPTVRRAPSLPRVSRRLAAAACAVVLAACVVVVAVPGPRDAVADLLGIGGVRVVTTREGPADTADEGVPADVAQEFDLGDSMPVDRALAEAPGPMAPADLGDPVAAFAGRPEGAVTLVWQASDDLPDITAAEPTGWGLIVTAFTGSTEMPVIFKPTGPSTTVQAVVVGGRAGYWISGAPHIVRVVAPSGDTGPDVVRLAGNTLLWTEGTTTYRLESALDRDAAVAVAESIVPTGG